MMENNKYVKEIVNIFDQENNLKQAHQKSKIVLEKMVQDSSFLFEVIKNNLGDPNYLKKSLHYPTLSLSILKNEIVDILINIFPNLPNQDTNTSHHSIHHHGNLMLSTIGISGPGYYTMIFNDNYKITSSGKVDNFKLISEFQNPVGTYTFCNAYVPHIVFYPADMSSTLLIWSKNKKSGVDKAKKIPVPKGLKKTVANSLNYLGLGKVLNLNDSENFDFYPHENEIFVIKDRIRYPNPDSNSNFIQNIMYYLQSIQFNDKSFLEGLMQKETTSELEKKWLTKYLSGENIEAVFEEQHLNVSNKININKQDLYNAVKN